jgi:hypothetical protein
MQSNRWNAVRTSSDVISGILNWVCPGCGGRMGGHGNEFKCQGQCQTDWRQTWERSFRQDPNRIWKDRNETLSPSRPGTQKTTGIL